MLNPVKMIPPATFTVDSADVILDAKDSQCRSGQNIIRQAELPNV